MTNVTNIGTDRLYYHALDKCKNWWGKEKLTDLYHKKFYKTFWNADRQAQKVVRLVKQKHETKVHLFYTVVEDKQSGKYFVVFYWNRFLKDYGNGTYLFLISDYGHFYI